MEPVTNQFYSFLLITYYLFLSHQSLM